MAKKPSAADRTVDMFTPAPIVVEHEAEEEKHERVTLEEDANRMRDKAFTVQDWTTKLFGIPEATGNEFRVSLKGSHYYVETLAKTPGTASAYGYTGVMVHERDLFNLATVIVAAVRAKQEREK